MALILDLHGCLSTTRRADLSVCRRLRPSDALAGDADPSANSNLGGSMHGTTERLTEWGVYSSRSVGIHGDTVLSVVYGRTLRQAANAELARTVGCLLRNT